MAPLQALAHTAYALKCIIPHDTDSLLDASCPTLPTLPTLPGTLPASSYPADPTLPALPYRGRLPHQAHGHTGVMVHWGDIRQALFEALPEGACLCHHHLPSLSTMQAILPLLSAQVLCFASGSAAVCSDYWIDTARGGTADTAAGVGRSTGLSFGCGEGDLQSDYLATCYLLCQEQPLHSRARPCAPAPVTGHGM